MKNRTALQELIEWVETELTLDGYEHQNIIDKIRELIPMEKQQIIDACVWGNRMYNNWESYLVTGKDYYERNFHEEEEPKDENNYPVLGGFRADKIKTAAEKYYKEHIEGEPLYDKIPIECFYQGALWMKSQLKNKDEK